MSHEALTGRLLVSRGRVFAVAALAAFCAVCVADQPAESTGEQKLQKAAATEAPAKPAPQEAARPTATDTREDHFPLPIWRGRTLEDVRELGGVLLNTTEGTLQIDELYWFVDENGTMGASYLRAYDPDGQTVEFGDAGALVPRVVKEDFLGKAMTGPDGWTVTEFDFGTDQDGYLSVIDATYKVTEEEDRDQCHFATIKVCQKEDCSGPCGEPSGQIQLVRGLQYAFQGPILQPHPIVCECMGDTGKCKLYWESTCKGDCLPGQTCTPMDNETCECRSSE